MGDNPSDIDVGISVVFWVECELPEGKGECEPFLKDADALWAVDNDFPLVFVLLNFTGCLYHVSVFDCDVSFEVDDDGDGTVSCLSDGDELRSVGCCSIFCDNSLDDDLLSIIGLE